MRLTAADAFPRWPAKAAWVMRLDGVAIGVVWELGYGYAPGLGVHGWNKGGSSEYELATTREAACEALIAACGLDATPPERWP